MKSEITVHSTSKIRVLVVEDHAVVRAGFLRLIDAEHDMVAVGGAGSAVTGLALLTAHECDVVLLDISVPGSSVAETIASVKIARPSVAILIVSMHPEEQYAIDLMRGGAQGFFSKAQPGDQLVSAIRTVASGRKYLSQTLASTLAASATGQPPKTKHGELSKREFEVFLQLAAGNSVTEIAETMGLSVKTISTYRNRVLLKMDFSRNADMTAYALRYRMLTDL